MLKISGSTRVVGIIGYPVKHSLSPVMHNAAFAECNLDYVYLPFTVTPEKLEDAVSGLRALGVIGFNVTIPHKTAIIQYLDRLDQSAEDAGAVNTVLIKDGHLIGYNTDGDGLVYSLAEDLDFNPGAGIIVVVGAGGAARGAVAALCREAAQRIFIINRSYEKAIALKAEMSRRYPTVCIETIENEELMKKVLPETSLLINTTSVGMNGDNIDFLNLTHLSKSAKVYDMVYSPAITPLIHEASGMGLMVSNGLGMLASQGERAFTIWTGLKPPRGLMKRVLEGICCT